jgi:hypothetical protein
MSSRLVLIVGAALVVYLVWSNQSITTLNIFSMQINLSGGMLVLIGYLIGQTALISYSLTIKTNQQKTNEHLEEWKKQDTKLAASVQSDREKQLEAKIETLESALKQALKRS